MINSVFKEFKITSTGVLHLGANTGQEESDYRKNGVRDIVWVEASPETHAKLVLNIANHPQSKALCACLSDIDGETVRFHEANNEGLSSSCLLLGTHKKEYPGVRYIKHSLLTTIRADTLLKQRRIEIENGWFLNVDLQGSELRALKGLGELIGRFSFALVEINEKPLYIGCPKPEEIDSHMKKHGFETAQTTMTINGWGNRLYKLSSPN